MKGKLISTGNDSTLEANTNLVEKILENPEEAFGYDGGFCYLAAIERADKWEVWSYCEESCSLCHEGTFDSHAEAIRHARERGAEILEEAEEAFADSRDSEWDARAAKSNGLTAPFSFQDNTGFPDGFELEDEEDVYAFFRRHGYLLRSEEWGNLYSCSLTDDNGTRCWVTQTDRGELCLEA